MARIAVVGIGAQTAVAATTGIPVLPNGIRQNDLMVCFVAGLATGTAGTADTSSMTAGWTLRGTRNRIEIGVTDVWLELWYKIAGATAETDPTVTVGTAMSTAGWSSQVVVFRGVDTTTPFDVTSVASGSGTAASTFTPTAVTTVTNNAVALSAVVTADDNALIFSVSQSFILLMGGANYATITGTDHAVGLAVKEITAAGSATQPTWSESLVGPDPWAAISTALRPASTVYNLEESFLGVDGAVWPVGLWTASNSAGSTSVLNAGSGRIILGAVGGYADSANNNILSNYLNNFEAWFDIKVGTANSVEFYGIFGFRATDAANEYEIQVVGGFGGNTVAFKKKVAGVETAFYSYTPALAVGDVVHVHLYVAGTTLRSKFWLNNAAEPSPWDFDGTDTTFVTGYMGFNLFGGSAAVSSTMYLSALQMQTILVLAPPPPRSQFSRMAILAR